MAPTIPESTDLRTIPASVETLTEIADILPDISEQQALAVLDMLRAFARSTEASSVVGRTVVHVKKLMEYEPLDRGEMLRVFNEYIVKNGRKPEDYQEIADFLSREGMDDTAFLKGFIEIAFRIRPDLIDDLWNLTLICMLSGYALGTFPEGSEFDPKTMETASDLDTWLVRKTVRPCILSTLSPYPIILKALVDIYPSEKDIANGTDTGAR